MLESSYQFISALLQSLMTCLKVLLRSNLFPQKLKQAKKDILILANGPSLKHSLVQLGEKIDDYPLMCVNKFPDTEPFEALRPEYFIVCSPGYWNTEAIDYNVDTRKKVIDALVSKTSWPLICLLPYQAKKNQAFIHKINSNNQIQIKYYNTTPVEGLDSISLMLMKNRLVCPRPHNVLITAIFNSVLLGFKNIYLLGADHSWMKDLSVNDDNEVLLNQKHFYDEESSIPRQMHKNEGHGKRNMYEVLEKFYYAFRSYHLLDAFANKFNASIINLTPDSFIDAFKKKSINELP